MAKATQKEKPDYHRLIIDLTPKERADLKKIADKVNRSVSRQAKVFILEAVSNHDAR